MTSQVINYDNSAPALRHVMATIAAFERELLDKAYLEKAASTICTLRDLEVSESIIAQVTAETGVDASELLATSPARI